MANNPPKYASAKETIILFGGLTHIQDELIESALRSLGDNLQALPNPDTASFQVGKAYGNRGQCNPTYFTVGNLIKYLQELQKTQGLTHEDIISRYMFATAGGCGPCRFGMYVTEYKKALKDAGFEGFRITTFDHTSGNSMDSMFESIINFTPKFMMQLVKAIMIGDILIMVSHKIRPYEIKSGAVDRAISECKKTIAEAFIEHKSILRALYKCRSIIKKVALHKTKKPNVMVIGEFWAASTQGEGNYNLHRFLESEGVEVTPQPITNRVLVSIWEEEQVIKQQATLQSEKAPIIDFSSTKQMFFMKILRLALLTHFKLYAKAVGLKNYHLADVAKLAQLAKKYYPLESNGGEGHMEVGHLLESIDRDDVDLVISVKPFGCMPSSSVSDGIQSLITHKYPEANFLSVETSGEGGANFYSRVQMALYRVKEKS